MKSAKAILAKPLLLGCLSLMLTGCNKKEATINIMPKQGPSDMTALGSAIEQTNKLLLDLNTELATKYYKEPTHESLMMQFNQILRIPDYAHIITDGFNGQDPDGMTALGKAAKAGDRKLVHWLLKCGAKADTVDRAGYGAIDYAIRNLNKDIIKLLLNSNHTLKIRLNPSDKMIALRNAIKENSLGIVRYLVTNRAPIHITSQFLRRPLLLAAEQGDCDIINDLYGKVIELCNPATKNSLDSAHYWLINNASGDPIKSLSRPLFLAAEYGNCAIVKYLYEQEVNHDNNLDINKTTSPYGKAALCLAVEQGYIDIVKHLYEQETYDNGFNLLVLALAIKNGHLPIVNFLVEGKKINDLNKALRYTIHDLDNMESLKPYKEIDVYSQHPTGAFNIEERIFYLGTKKGGKLINLVDKQANDSVTKYLKKRRKTI
ncbi:ankyrin repeat domain-containing protein [Candidatus Cardinium hertigii]|uniref:Uncharacterized protein n=1 Tax=Candidatus Cardinium hertigii TaxID=247481 RepID=A0A2Z3LED8_9BACT|nr:ankyrin repeat domain-containing protein [Candidatus Cardinium hertigii]AWN82086.1 hypothetical protein DK880_00777 [Candidatus Cardinium hertigii]